MEYNPDKREIKTERILSDLDKFVLDFIGVLEKYADYVIISGYVSIILGRTRTTEDVDLFIKKISEEKLAEIYKNLKKAGFWCLNTENPKEMYHFLTNKMAIRFSRTNFSVPNFEVKFPKDKTDEESFNDFITVILSGGKLRISSLERHIAFKKYYLSSDKDIEDALHIEELFRSKIDYDKINKLKELIKIRKNGERKNFFKTGQK